MIIHKLIARHLQHRDDPGFYAMQALDAISWLERYGTRLGTGVRVLDLGCGHGVFGRELQQRGCEVTFADESNGLMPEIGAAKFIRINIDKEDVSNLGTFDLVICSNVLEHLAKPGQFLEASVQLLAPHGRLYLSWTNWLSPWGGHEFSPFHYLGPRRGHLVYDRLVKRPRIHTPFQNLYPTYIGEMLRMVRANRALQVIKVAPRYYPELAFLMSLPGLREFLAWNCALLIGRRADQ